MQVNIMSCNTNLVCDDEMERSRLTFYLSEDI